MAEIRDLIFDDLETVLDALDGMTYEGIGDILPDITRMPQVSIIPVIEVTTRSGTEPEIYEEILTVKIRTLVDESHQNAGKELGRYLGDIHRAVMADPHRNNLADRTRKTGTDWLFLAPDRPQAGADLVFDIGYFTAAKDPASQVI